jgi:hypothetical protein
MPTNSGTYIIRVVLMTSQSCDSVLSSVDGEGVALVGSDNAVLGGANPKRQTTQKLTF